MGSEIRYTSRTGHRPVRHPARPPVQQRPDMPSDGVKPRRCRCGKDGWPTEAAAKDVVVRAKVALGLRNNRNRREQRAYPCDLVPGIWHVTSQQRSTGAKPDYSPDDDETAREFIERAVFHDDPRPWEALLGPTFAVQTYRVLTAWRADLIAEIAERAAAAKRAGGAALDEHRRYTAPLHPVRLRLDALIVQAREVCGVRAPRVRTGQPRTADVTPGPDSQRWDRMRRHTARVESLERYWRAMARRLAVAVGEHQRAYGRSPGGAADRELWALLGEIRTPVDADQRAAGDAGRSLAELVGSGDWHDGGGPLVLDGRMPAAPSDPEDTLGVVGLAERTDEPAGSTEQDEPDMIAAYRRTRTMGGPPPPYTAPVWRNVTDASATSTDIEQQQGQQEGTG